VVDQELRVPLEQLDKRLRSVLGLEVVLLLDRDPRQRLPLAGKLVARRVSSFSSASNAMRGRPLLAVPFFTTPSPSTASRRPARSAHAYPDLVRCLAFDSPYALR
jgi:hypothetical protein